MSRQAAGTDRRTRIVLGRGRKHTADAGIIEKIDRRRLGLGDGLDRQPDDRITAQQPPRILDRHVLLPDMDAIGPGCERNIDAVIDEQAATPTATAPP